MKRTETLQKLKESSELIYAIDKDGNIIYNRTPTLEESINDLKRYVNPADGAGEGTECNRELAGMVLEDKKFSYILEDIIKSPVKEIIKDIVFKEDKTVIGRIDAVVIDGDNNTYLLQFRDITSLKQRKNVMRRVKDNFKKVGSIMQEVYPALKINKCFLVYRLDEHILTRRYYITPANPNR